MPWFSCCRRPRYVKVGKARAGIQQEKCSACGRLRNRQVRPCFFRCSYRNDGKPSYGTQQQACTRCGSQRETQARRCWGPCRYSGWGRAALGLQASVQCTRCGTVRIVRGAAA